MEVYKWFVAKEKTLYQQLNGMKQAQSSYIGYFWAPDEEEQKLRDELSNYPTSEMVKFTQHKMKPPTYIKTNDFTWAF